MNPIKIIYHGKNSTTEVYEYLLDNIPKMITYLLEKGTDKQLRDIFLELSEGQAYIKHEEFKRQKPAIAEKPKFDNEGMNPENIYENKGWTIPGL